MTRERAERVYEALSPIERQRVWEMTIRLIRAPYDIRERIEAARMMGAFGDVGLLELAAWMATPEAARAFPITSLEELRALYTGGMLTDDDTLIMDNDYSFLYVQEKCVFRGGGPKELIHEALDLLGVPSDVC